MKSCAAKHKSGRALRGDQGLFEQLSRMLIYTTNDISTSLVLPLTSGTISVQSDRLSMHHDISGGMIKIYIPEDQDLRRVCYRSQLPKLLAKIMDVGDDAAYNILSIITASLRDLYNILSEQDIPSVEWITRPILEIAENVVDDRPCTPVSIFVGSDTTTLLGQRSALLTPEPTPLRYPRPAHRSIIEESAESTPPSRYPELIGQVVRSARNAAMKYNDLEGEIEENAEPQYIDNTSAFGSEEWMARRRIGAAGEAYVNMAKAQSI